MSSKKEVLQAAEKLVEALDVDASVLRMPAHVAIAIVNLQRAVKEEKSLEQSLADRLARECDRLQKTLDETWKVIGGPPEHPEEDPEVAELPNAVRICIGYEADKALQMRDQFLKTQAELAQAKRERDFVAAPDDAFWIWSDTDPNELSSLVDGALVKLTAGQLRKLLSQEHLP